MEFKFKDTSSATGIEIYRKEIFEINGRFDLIIFNHSFEHMLNQQTVLEKSRELLSDKGWILIRQPMADSVAWKEYGVNWVQLDAPRHFVIHTSESMKVLLDQCNLFTKKELRDSTEFQFWGSEQYKNDISLHDERSWLQTKDKSIFSQEQIDEFRIQAQKVNESGTGDQASFFIKLT